MSRKIIKDYNFKLKCRTYLDKRRLVDDSTYKPYEVLVKQMLDSGAVNIMELNNRSNMLFNTSDSSDKSLSITNVKGVDKYDIDNHLSKIRETVVDTHKKASAEFNKINKEKIEEHYKQKYSKDTEKDTKSE